MTTFAAPAAGLEAIEALLADELAAEDRAFADTGTILGHLLRRSDRAILSDEIVARTRGMLHDCGRQLAFALHETSGAAEPDERTEAAAALMGEALAERPAFVAHVHSLAVEWQITDDLRRRTAIDPVLSPLLQSRIASPDAATASEAVGLLAAQARFGQQQRRMQLPLAEMPGELLDDAIGLMHAYAEGGTSFGGDSAQTEQVLRQRHDESSSRLGLLRRVVGSLENGAEALALDNAGVAMFLTALAMGNGMARQTAVMAATEARQTRLVLSLAACGLDAHAINAQVLMLNPRVMPARGIDLLRQDIAAAVLAGHSIS